MCVIGSEEGVGVLTDWCRLVIDFATSINTKHPFCMSHTTHAEVQVIWRYLFQNLNEKYTRFLIIILQRWPTSYL